MDTGQQNLFGPAPLTLSQFTQAIGNAVRMSPVLQGAWVMAELSDVRVNGGHCYMELIEKNASGATVAKLRATVWSGQYRMVRQKFMAATGRDICSGIKVMLYGAAAHHPVYGLSFAVGDIDPSYTLGDMERLRREILERLQREGILSRNKALAMPAAPQRVAVVSAAGAAGYGDFLNQLLGNQEGMVFYPFLFPAVMQGDRTVGSVIYALDYIEHTVDLWDCVVIIRGGGATTDLNGFDNYDLARRVALFPLPVVVGIGHERDRTVLDEIAHTRCKTPTAVAAFLVDTVRQSYARATQCVEYIVRHAADMTAGEKLRLHNAETLLPAVVGRRLSDSRSHLSAVAARLPLAVGTRTSSASARLASLANLIEPMSVNVIDNARRRLSDIVSRMSTASANVSGRTHSRLESLAELVDALSPDNTLRRGYSVTRAGGKAVTDASRLAEGDVIVTRLYSGEVVSVVRKPLSE